jgi:hypothetical protein
LSLDATTGGTTSYFEFPPAWHGNDTAHYHSFAEEVFVLGGDITLDGEDYFHRGDYLYRPGGIVHGHHEGSHGGSRMLIRTGGPLDFNYVREPTSAHEYVLVPNTDGRGQVLHLKTEEMSAEWVGTGRARYARKALSTDTRTGATTALLEFPAAWRGRVALDPPMSAEWFVVAGGAVLADGTAFETESYGFRPPGTSTAWVSAQAGTRILLWREP